ncbi:MAG TPA: PIG-L deacetylase family protein [Polyangiales bacterium]|nr:PIG-L deacetylase family protein [Polyangiales bacterium]
MTLPVQLGSGPLRVLCLGAHSDDIEIGCGGTLLRLLAERPGSSVEWCVFSANADREREARASAADFLADAAQRNLRVAQFRESYFPEQWAALKDHMGELGRTLQPDLVFTHRRADLHQDHRVIAELSWNTFRKHLLLEYEIPKWEGDLGHPNLFVPLSRAQADRKVELLQRHFASQAQKPWFRADTFHGLMSVRAVECHAPEGRAEAFHAPKLIV